MSGDAGDGDRGSDRLGPVDRVLSGRVAELRPAYLPPDPASRTSYAAGEIAQCDFWFPPIRVGQTRAANQLPVLTMITGYARWASGFAAATAG